MGHEYDAMRNMEARMAAQERKLASVSSEVLYLKLSMDSNTEALREYIEISKSLKVGLRFLGYIEIASVWFVKVGAAITLTWAAWRFLVREAVQQLMSK